MARVCSWCGYPDRGWLASLAPLGSALKPAYEPIVLARKPLVGTVARNVLSHGTGALNIDGCRVETTDDLNGGAYSENRQTSESDWIKNGGTIHSFTGRDYVAPSGRWPANLAHDGSPEVLAEFPVTSSGGGNKSGKKDQGVCYGKYGAPPPDVREVDSGSAARFFYCAKASKSDRNEGLDDLPEQPSAASEFRPNHTEGAAAGEDGNPYGRWSPVRNAHPTVKPTALMQWLVRLVTPPGGLVLDPFTGSGSTGKAAMLEGFSFVGCEMDPEYAKIARLRIDHAVNSR